MTQTAAMNVQPRQSRWSISARLFHWTTAAIVLVMLPMGWLLDDVRDTATKFSLLQLHKSLGLTVLGLTFIRLAMRAATGRPPYSSSASKYELMLARAAHVLLFLFLIVMPLSGWIGTAASPLQIPLEFFGLFTVPSIAGPSKAVSGFFFDVHSALATIIAIVVGLHILGALKHAIVDRDGTLSRMWFGRA